MCWFLLALRTANRAAHFAGIALQTGFVKGAAGDFGDQGDHLGADGLVVTPDGIAEADDFYARFCMKNNILAAIADDIGAGRVKKFRCRLGTAGGEKQGEQELHFGRMAGFG